MKMLKTIIVDDHAMFRSGLRVLIDSTPGVKIVAEFSDGNALLEDLENLEADLLLIDHDMPRSTGMDVVIKLRKLNTDIRIILLTGVTNEALLADYANLVEGIVMKSDDDETLSKALATVRDGGEYLSEATRELAERMSSNAKLTSRERQVVRHIAKGLSNKEISKVMGIAPKTVDVHRTNLMNKLNLHNVAEVVAFAVRTNLV